MSQLSHPIQLEIENVGATTLNVLNIVLEGLNPQDFAVGALSSSSIAPASSATLPITFTATLTAHRMATLRIDSNDPASPHYVSLSGDGGGDSSQVAIRINAGASTNFIDSSGRLWLADPGPLPPGGGTFQTSAAINNTFDDFLYQTELWNADGFTYAFPVPHGEYHVNLHFAEIFHDTFGQRIFDVSIEGVKVLDDFDIFDSAGGKFFPYVFTTNPPPAQGVPHPVHVHDGLLEIEFTPESLGSPAPFGNPKISAIEIVTDEHLTGHPYLHVVIDAPDFLVDFDQDGFEDVDLNGTGSHTHEPGKSLTEHRWTNNGVAIGNTAAMSTALPVGENRVALTILDNNTPPSNLSAKKDIPVYQITEVGGVLAAYYPLVSGSLLDLIDNIPSSPPAFKEVLADFRIPANGSQIGGTSLSSDVVVVLQGELRVPTGGSYTFQLQGGTLSRLFINGNPYTSPVVLGAGNHAIEVRFALASTANLPSAVLMQLGAGTPAIITRSQLFHNEAGLDPFINKMPSVGFPGGGNDIIIEGIGFFPTSSVSVIWDGAPLPSSNIISVTPTEIKLIEPAGTANTTIDVQVQTPNGLSNTRQYTYDENGPVPIRFSARNDLITNISQNPYGGATRGTWGPDGRFYVGTLSGNIYIYTFDDQFNVTNTQVVTAISATGNPAILGLGFNPHEAPNPPRLYVAHGAIYSGGAMSPGETCPMIEPFPYRGSISVLEGPNFTVATPVIRNLPVSDHDHSTSAIEFDDYGNLYFSSGGNSNAGVPDEAGWGCIPESPLSGAILKSPITAPGYTGPSPIDIVYLDRNTQLPAPYDQRFGDQVEIEPGTPIDVYTSGNRNAFDIVWTTWGWLYGTDNGPNNGLGSASTGPNTSGPSPNDDDEISLLRPGHYYGHPNRNRALNSILDFRENIYFGTSAPHALGVYTPPIGTVPPSTNGIEEYRSATFGGQLRGALVAKDWDQNTYFISLSPSKRLISRLDSNGDAFGGGLDIVTAPGGGLLVVDYLGDKVRLLEPNDVSANGMQALDISPWRARADRSDVPFVIGGRGFSGATSVSIGGIPATVTSVSPNRIRGTLPNNPNATADLLDVVVTSAGGSSTLEKAFRFLLPPRQGRGTWQVDSPLLRPMREGAMVEHKGVLYVFGRSGSTPNSFSAKTFAYDFVDGIWREDLAERPAPGDHHTANVVGDKIYVIGGFPDQGGQPLSPAGQVQIYDIDSDTWSLGAPIPNGLGFPGSTGSLASAVIDGKIYVAGGLVNDVLSTSSAAVYDPVANSWTSIAPMPQAVDHAASGTDGEKFYIFGGRVNGHILPITVGTFYVQIYDPVTNTWQSSEQAGSTIPRLPVPRGGMGRAVFFQGEFYVIGGETTLAAAPPNGVYDRVDVYNPVTRTWRLERPMAHAVHGISPVVYDGRIYVAGGGATNGGDETTFFQDFRR